jgi:predicted transcriptional regulator
MQRNYRKLQILQILFESPLSVEDIADKAGINKHNALVYCLRYWKWGLLQKINSNPTTFDITDRGIQRIEYLLSKRGDVEDAKNILY